MHVQRLTLGICMKYYLVYVSYYLNEPCRVNSYDSKEAQLKQYDIDSFDPEVKVFIVDEIC